MTPFYIVSCSVCLFEESYLTYFDHLFNPPTHKTTLSHHQDTNEKIGTSHQHIQQDGSRDHEGGHIGDMKQLEEEYDKKIQEIVTLKDEESTHLSDQISSLNTKIQEMKEDKIQVVGELNQRIMDMERDGDLRESSSDNLIRDIQRLEGDVRILEDDKKKLEGEGKEGKRVNHDLISKLERMEQQVLKIPY